MGFYQDRILPWLIHLSMRQTRLAPYRSRVVSAATGRVLEIGIGSGLNLPFYGNSVSRMIGLDPSPKLLDMTREAARRTSVPLKLLEGTAEAIPIHNRNIDTIVTTWTMCSIPEVERALAEMHRVLKAGGRLLFVEHGRAPEPGVRWWQDHLTPAWKRFSGGCHLNRPIGQMIENAGVQFERLENSYMRGPKPMTFMYEGSARRSAAALLPAPRPASAQII
jgi:ubiquinone/menaquinone biosynthesis C-methylase UbiE